MSLTVSVNVLCVIHATPGARGSIIECKVGVPYQGDIRELATDRWIQMYPDD